jgi:ribosome-binding protein aMBF1 (putative translation factor)
MGGTPSSPARAGERVKAMRAHKKKRSEEVAVHFGKNLMRARRQAGLSQEVGRVPLAPH